MLSTQFSFLLNSTIVVDPLAIYCEVLLHRIHAQIEK
jgi:hypothetical protein